MRLSVIIVNYNVKYFLEQCLLSLQKSLEGIDSEVFVIDNKSSDGSVEFISERFPNVTLIANEDNVGYSKANNQGIRISKGEYVLLLNPDTVVEENSMQKMLDFMDAHPDAGASGIKMIDGKGQFLAESKRSIPYPMVSFYKVFGLASLFPKSKTFGKYHLGYLDENKNHEVEVLCGAFMFIRKSALDKSGLLDETFFMYGEDIDLSYRILQAGYKNYYFAESTIIHYKGESTKKGSLNYVRIFYQAMAIFAKKHFSSSQAGIYNLLITFAIWFRAGLSIVHRFLGRLWLPLTDALLLYVGMYFLKEFWEMTVKSNEGLQYPEAYMIVNVPIYILIWLLSLYYTGGYDKPIRLLKIFSGLVLGTILVSASYAFFEEAYRFSRAMIVVGGIWAVVVISIYRWVLHFMDPANFQMEGIHEKKILIVGSISESNRVLDMLNQFGSIHNFIGVVSTTNEEGKKELVGYIDQLPEIIRLYHAEEVIFCAKDVSSQQIIDLMISVRSGVDFKIVPQEGSSIIGSNSKNASGELYALDINLSLAKSESKRNKRLYDLATSLILLATFPVNMFLVKKPLGLLANIFKVVNGKYSWVGYSGEHDDVHETQLPKIPKGILSGYLVKGGDLQNESNRKRLDYLYARDYSVWQDLDIVWKGYKLLGS